MITSTQVILVIVGVMVWIPLGMLGLWFMKLVDPVNSDEIERDLFVGFLVLAPATFIYGLCGIVYKSLRQLSERMGVKVIESDCG